MGDSITDEYRYVVPQGMSTKDYTITTRFRRSEFFDGGVQAAAHHLEGFCARVHVMTGDTSIVKTRFVEESTTRKMFEVHDSRRRDKSASYPIEEYDLVVVTDFGHGYVDGKLIRELTEKARYLAVNAQTNSSNRGFNLVTKYPRADYVVIDSLEARLAVQDRESEMERVIEEIGFNKIVVTRGNEGAIGYDGDFHYAPSLKRKVVDTMGAGDAFFCVTAPFSLAGASMPELLQIGNAAGAIKCEAVGQRPVDKASLMKALWI